ncbi:hypothetical protein BH09PAT2_BH09PAT2_00450 [soil metagenome]
MKESFNGAFTSDNQYVDVYNPSSGIATRLSLNEYVLKQKGITRQELSSDYGTFWEPKLVDNTPIGKLVNIQKNSRLFNKGDEVSDIYFLQHGSIDLHLHGRQGKNLNKSVQVMNIVNEGELIGIEGILQLPIRKTFAQTQIDSQILVLSPEDFLKLYSEDSFNASNFRLNLIHQIIYQNDSLEEKTMDLVYGTVKDRLIEYLATQEVDENGILYITHEQIAEDMGAYRETISAMLRTLKAEGLISLGYRHIKVDQEMLTDYLF